MPKHSSDWLQLPSGHAQRPPKPEIDARGDDFLRGLERYRLSVDPIVEDDQKLMALLNFFAFGHTVFQFTLLQNAALNTLTVEYLKIIPVINRINDNSNKLILSKISKQDGYRFASQVQDAIDKLLSS